MIIKQVGYEYLLMTGLHISTYRRTSTVRLKNWRCCGFHGCVWQCRYWWKQRWRSDSVDTGESKGEGLTV